MAYFPKKKRTLKGKKRIVRRRRVVKKSGKPTRAFAKAVQSVVSRNVENKIYQAMFIMPCYYASAAPIS